MGDYWSPMAPNRLMAACGRLSSSEAAAPPGRFAVAACPLRSAPGCYAIAALANEG